MSVLALLSLRDERVAVAVNLAFSSLSELETPYVKLRRELKSTYVCAESEVPRNRKEYNGKIQEKVAPQKMEGFFSLI